MPNLEDILIMLEGIQEQISQIEQGNTVIDASQVLIQSLSDFGTNETGIPTGGVYLGMFMGSCPSGWSRQSQFDDRTVYGATSYGATGGTSSATTGSHTHGAGSYDTDSSGNHDHSYTYRSTTGVTDSGSGKTFWEGTSSPNTGSDGAHSHNVSGTSDSGGAGGTNWPPYRAVVFCSP